MISLFLSITRIVIIAFIIYIFYRKKTRNHEASTQINVVEKICNENGAESNGPIFEVRKENLDMSNEKTCNKYNDCLESINRLMYESYNVCSWRWVSAHPLTDIQEKKQCVACVTPFGEQSLKVTLLFSDDLLATKITDIDSQENVAENAVPHTENNDISAETAEKIAVNYVSDNVTDISTACQEAIAKGETSFTIYPKDTRPAVLAAIAGTLTNNWHNYKSAEVLEDGGIKASVDLVNDDPSLS